MLSADVEEIFRAILEKSVRHSVETDIALSAALSVSSLPTKNNLSEVAQAIAHTANNTNSEQVEKKKPP